MLEEQQYIEQLQGYFPGQDKQILDRVLEYAAYLYKSLYRYSGESYYQRALRLTCEKILKLKPDRATIIASILISACYSPRCDLKKVEELFGEEVRRLVSALGKINSIKSRYSSSDTKIISNMFLTLAEDIRVILIRLADRIENLETLQFKTPEKQKANAREILDVYVPIASKLGLYEFKLQLEDMAFKYVFPDEYDSLKKELEDYLGQTSKTVEETKHDLEALMRKNGFEVVVSGRVKNLFSIYKKLKKKTRTLNEIYDVYALRVVLKSDEDQEEDSQEDIEKLYKILSILHSEYEHLDDRFKDYVSNPKSNGYMSLHTALVGLNSGDPKKPTEIQIRTSAMHKFAEHGYAAHWLYKERNKLPQDDRVLNALSDLRTSWQTIDISTAELKMNLYTDRVFVLTPDNLVKELPVGATPLDFAFAVHSEIGHHYYLARVNGNAVSLDYQLKNGDVVEIVTTPKVTTKLSWMEFVKTKQARNRIKNHFRNADKDSLLEQGRLEMNALFDKLKMEHLDEGLTFLKTYKGKNQSLKEREELIEEIGAGVISPTFVFRNVIGRAADSLLNPERIHKPKSSKLKMFPKTSAKTSGHPLRLMIGGEKNMPYRMSSCCKPRLSDRVVGYITKNNGVSIHKINCAFVANATSERLLEARLESDVQTGRQIRYQVALILELKERDGYLKEIIEFFNKLKVTIINFSLPKKEGGLLTRRVLIDIIDDDQLEEIITSLYRIDGITKVSRV